MNKKIILLSVNLVLFFHFTQAQKASLSGFVMDSITNEKLIDASIYDLNSKMGVTTNTYGFYSLNMPTNAAIKLHISFIGYKEKIIELELSESTSLNISLTPDNVLDEVIIRNQAIQKRNDMGLISIPLAKVNKLPSIGGEPDVIKALQLMPGVQSGGEATSSLYVRGGSPDQNLILLDEVPLYYVNHMGGFVSVFNTDAISKVNLYKGGFPASYGGRLSSVIDISMKEGNYKKFQGSGLIGMIASKLSIEGPIQKGTTSYILSYRRMLYDLFTKAYASFAKPSERSAYHFYDINAKINHKFSEEDHIYFSFYMGDDKFQRSKMMEGILENRDESAWGNRLFSLRWNRLFSKKLFSNFTISHTKYRLNATSMYKWDDETDEFNYKSSIADSNLKMDFSWYLHPNYKIKFGAKTSIHTFNPGQASAKTVDTSNNILFDTIVSNNRLNSLEISSYIENKIKFKTLKTNLGLHYSNYIVNNKVYHSIEPRFLMNWNFKSTYSIRASYTEMQQNIHLLSAGVASFPLDLWMPATDKAPPERSKQISLGLAKSSDNGLYEFSIESYYKSTKDLITYKGGVDYIEISDDWEEHIEKDGTGSAYGIEFLVKKRIGKSTGWASYTWSKTQRQFDNINEGKVYPYHYDRRHSVNLVYQLNIKKNIDFSATWVFNSGKAITLAESRYPLLSDEYGGINGVWFPEAYNYTSKNGFRMRAFHKLDLGINFRKEKKWGERTWNISIYNVYNRQNPYYYFFDTEYEHDNQGNAIEGSDKTKLKQRSLFPILPSVSYSFKF